MSSNVRQNYHKESEDGVNKQINLELYAMYTYLSMVRPFIFRSCVLLFHFPFPFQANYYDRHDVALPGVSKFFKKSAMEELDHAQKLMDFQNKRGGTVQLEPINKPAKNEWGSALEGMKAAQELERTVNQALLDLHKVSDCHGDFQVRFYYVWCMCVIQPPFPVR